MLNSTLDDISAVIGFSATVRLAANYGDRDIHVPSTVSELNPITKLIGLSRMRALHAHWQGERISVPTLKIVESELRRAKVLDLLIQGILPVKIAEHVSLTERRIHQLKREFILAGLIPGKS